MSRLWFYLTLLAFLASSQAFAIDCAKATYDYEKAICADPKLVAADDALSRFYFDRLKSLTGEAHDLLQADQRYWVETRGADCRPLTAGCLSKDIAARRRAIVVCTRPPDTPAKDPTNEVECLYYHHGGCPSLNARGSANLAQYPFLLHRLVTESKESLSGFDCDPASPHSRSDDNVGNVYYRIVGERPGVLSIAINVDGCARGAAHCYSSEQLETWDTNSQAEITFSALFSNIDTQSCIYSIIKRAVNGNLDKPCCGSETVETGLSIGSLGVDENTTLPAGWSVTPDGNLTLAYAYSSLDHGFLSHATIPRASFIIAVAPKYTSLFDPLPR